MMQIHKEKSKASWKQLEIARGTLEANSKSQNSSFVKQKRKLFEKRKKYVYKISTAL